MTVEGAARSGKKVKRVAVVNAEFCTGCLVCVAVCPVHCIDAVESGEGPGFTVCRVDAPRCVGCVICAKDCPWEAISMVPASQKQGVIAQ